MYSENTKEKSTVELTPHINLSDGFHYAENIKLPGVRSDTYKIKFTVSIDEKNLTYHNDWKELYSYPLFDEKEFEYSNLDFKKMAEAVRNWISMLTNIDNKPFVATASLNRLNFDNIAQSEHK